MALKIRLRRMGRRNAPTYRIVVAESSMPRDGRIVESLGHYNPRTNPKTLQVDRARSLYWIDRGAVPTDTAQALLNRAGIFRPEEEANLLAAAAANVSTAAKTTARKATSKVKAAASKIAGAVSGATEGVRETAGGVIEKAGSVAGGVMERAGSVIEKAEDVIEAVVERAEDAVEAVTDAAEDAVDAVKARAKRGKKDDAGEEAPEATADAAPEAAAGDEGAPKE